MRSVLLVACCLSTVVVEFQTPQPRAGGTVTGTARISGTVLTGGAGSVPVRRATMTIKGSDRNGVQLVAVTDDEGRFAFTGLPADRYSLSAAKAAYLPWNYGSKRPGGSGTPIVLADGQRVAIEMALPKGSVLTGTVRDAQGRPLPDVTVSALQYRYEASFSSGERELQSADIGSSFAFPGYAPEAFPGTAGTDDRGVYRIYGLAPGEYIVSASVRPPRGNPTVSTDIHQVSRADVQRAQLLLRGSPGAAPMGAAPGGAAATDTARVNYAPAYYPAAIALADASIVTLGRAEERAGIDVVVRLVPTANLTGTVTRDDGTPLAGAQVHVSEKGPTTAGRTVRLTRTMADGTFSVAGLNPGRYTLRSHTYPEGLSGVMDVDIAGRDVSASIALTSGGTVSGQLVFDGTAKPPAASAVILRLWPSPFPGVGYEMGDDGHFVLSRVTPGTYRLRINGRPPAGWLVRSAMVNGVDASDIAFEVRSGETVEGAVVTLTDRGAEVSGRFIDAAGMPAPGYVLVIFSADKRSWVPNSRRTQQVRPDVNGTFVARDLPAGDYLISAVTDLEDGEWNDPAFLAELAAHSPVRVTLAEGERKVQDIRIGG